jgi:hypothetical protein
MPQNFSEWPKTEVLRDLARLSLKSFMPDCSSGRNSFRSRAMIQIRLSFAFVATVAAALTTFVTVAPQPTSARTVACTNSEAPVLA